MAEAADIAEAILFLASDSSRFMTGTEIVVDGGYKNVCAQESACWLIAVAMLIAMNLPG